MTDIMNLDTFKKYIEDYEGLNRLWRIEHHIINKSADVKQLATLHHEYAKQLRLYIKAKKYSESIGAMYQEATFKNEKDEFEKLKKETQAKLNHAKSMNIKDNMQIYYSEMGDLYLSIGDTENAITQFRLAHSHVSSKSATSLIPSLKKCQLYLFEEEELKV